MSGLLGVFGWAGSAVAEEPEAAVPMHFPAESGGDGALALLPFAAGLSWPYWIGFVGMAGILAYEHAIVKPDDLSRVDKAFFDLNGYVSLAFLAVVLLAR